MKKVIKICDFIKAVCKVSKERNVYYISITKHYESGKKYTECVFISANEFDDLIKKFGEPIEE